MITTAAPALRLPMAFGLDCRRSTGFRAAPEKYARLEDEAARRGWSVQRLLDWLTDQVLDLAFLDVENRDFIRDVAANLGRPFTVFDVLNRCVSEVRQLATQGKLVLGAWTRPAGNLKPSATR